MTLKPGSLTALGPTPTGTTCDTPCPHLGFLSLSCDVRLRPGKSVVQMSTGNHAGVPRKMQSPGLHPAPLNSPGQGCGRGQTVPGVCKRQPSTQWAKSIPQAGQGPVLSLPRSWLWESSVHGQEAPCSFPVWASGPERSPCGHALRDALIKGGRGRGRNL